MAGSRHRSHEVAGLIEKGIASGVYAVGQKLPAEIVLCEEYGVSRTVIREALKQLTGRGMVVTRNGAGSYVTSCRPAQLGDALRRIGATADRALTQDMVELWAYLETGFARRLVDRNLTGGVKTLEGALAGMYRALAVEDIAEFTRAYVEFHRSVIALSANELLQEAYRALENTLYYHVAQLATDADMRRTLLIEHEEIVKGLIAGDNNRAVELLNTHIFSTLKRWTGMEDLTPVDLPEVQLA